jgi:hypothetical protein
MEYHINLRCFTKQPKEIDKVRKFVGAELLIDGVVINSLSEEDLLRAYKDLVGYSTNEGTNNVQIGAAAVVGSIGTNNVQIGEPADIKKKRKPKTKKLPL